MPRPCLRSRSLRRTAVRLPGGAHVIRYSRLKTKGISCAGCGKKLSISATGKSRAFGGNLCSSCSKARVKAKFGL